MAKLDFRRRTAPVAAREILFTVAEMVYGDRVAFLAARAAGKGAESLVPVIRSCTTVGGAPAFETDADVMECPAEVIDALATEILSLSGLTDREPPEKNG